PNAPLQVVHPLAHGGQAFHRGLRSRQVADAAEHLLKEVLRILGHPISLSRLVNANPTDDTGQDLAGRAVHPHVGARGVRRGAPRRPPASSASCGSPATGWTSSEEPTTRSSAASRASCEARSIASTGISSPKKTTSGFNTAPQRAQRGTPCCSTSGSTAASG